MVTPDALAAIPPGLAALSAARPGYDQTRAYYHGRHTFRFSTEKYRNAFAHIFHRLSLNLCRGVVNAPADRLELTGFSVEQGAATLGDAAWEIWQRNRMDIRAGNLHKHALRSGNSYAILWPNPAGVPTVYPQKADTVTVVYDEERPGELHHAIKAWFAAEWDQASGANRYRLLVTVYFADRIEKYQLGGPPRLVPSVADISGRSLSERLEERVVEGEAWPLPNLWNTVPVFHFANDEFAAPGYSELEDIIPVQDALNKTVYDKMVAAEFAAFPQRWATGLEVETDDITGRAIPPFETGNDRMIVNPAPDGAFGAFPTVDLVQYLEVEREYKLSIAQISGTPLHYLSLSTDPPSGEALKTLEARFVKKVKDRQSAFGSQWESLAVLALRMAGLAGEEARLRAQWAPAETRSEESTWTVLGQKAALGVDTETILREGGYGEKEAADMAAKKAAVDALGAPMRAVNVAAPVASR